MEGPSDTAPTRALGTDLSASSLGVPREPSLTSSATSRSRLSDAGTVDLPQPETVLRGSEIEQTRRMSLSGVLFNGAALAFTPLVGGDPFARNCFLVGLAVALVNNGWLWFVSSDERRYRQGWLLLFFTVAPIPNALILYYVGVFGPLMAMFVLNVYTACLAYRERVARFTLVASVLPVAVLGGWMSITGVEDPGLITAGPILGGPERGLLVAGFVVFLLLTYGQARSSRELVVAALVERDAAVRAASHREAMFIEARQDLERALQAGGLGRFTDQTLGSFKLGVVLGRGGMGEVYEATHVETGEPAALKMLRPEVLGHADYVRRFLREVHIAASLDSPNVVRVLEIGDESAPMPYLAMERLQGGDLGQILRVRERLEPAEVVDLVRQVGRGIEAAQRAGIVHRDLKPQNLFLTDDTPPVWKILDFGISKLARSGDTLTRGEAIGTPHYMAPEQARGRTVDARTDLYALGAIAYRALTGHQPFAGDESAAVLLKVLDQMPVRPSALVEVPPPVDHVLAVALAKRPSDRFQSVSELADALEGALAGKGNPLVRRRARAILARRPFAEPAA